MNLIDKAKEFATKAHEGQFRKDGVTPYIKHPLAVAELVQEYAPDINPDMICVAWLHDVTEDCEIDPNTLEKEFNGVIAEAVASLSKNLWGGKGNYYRQLRDARWEIKFVKMCDRLANLRDTLDDFRNGQGDKNFAEYYIYDTYRLLSELKYPITKDMTGEILRTILEIRNYL